MLNNFFISNFLLMFNKIKKRTRMINITLLQKLNVSIGILTFNTKSFFPVTKKGLIRTSFSLIAKRKHYLQVISNYLESITLKILPPFPFG
jgi:hypothetical protein